MIDVVFYSYFFFLFFFFFVVVLCALRVYTYNIPNCINITVSSMPGAASYIGLFLFSSRSRYARRHSPLTDTRIGFARAKCVVVVGPTRYNTRECRCSLQKLLIRDDEWNDDTAVCDSISFPAHGERFFISPPPPSPFFISHNCSYSPLFFLPARRRRDTLTDDVYACLSSVSGVGTFSFYPVNVDLFVCEQRKRARSTLMITASYTSYKQQQHHPSPHHHPRENGWLSVRNSSRSGI